MSHALGMEQAAAIRLQLSRMVGWLSSFALAAMAGLAMAMNVIVESFHSARLGAVLVCLLLLHLLRHRRFPVNREAVIYICFLCYMVVALAWTSDFRLAMNTLVPAITFVLVLILFGALVTCHNLQAVLAGMLCGILLSAAVYTRQTGFPFAYPSDFSYNAIAGMFLLAAFIALLCSCYWRAKLPFLLVGLVCLILVVATTSIKFNVGLLLGTIAAGFLYFRHFTTILRRNAIPLAVLAGILGYVVASDDGLMATLERGADRVMLGVDVLQARQNEPGYTAFESRRRWQSAGLEGWRQNPLFGHGVEAFRDRHGVTSHSTPVDLLYNFGLIGLALFYAVVGSIAWRLLRAKDRTRDSVGALIFGVLACYLFVSLSAPLHYNGFFAVFVTISAHALRGHTRSDADAAAPRAINA
jgi:O-antigen ligase